MKIYLIAALFLAALVVAHAEDVELPEQDVELPEQPEQQDQPDEGVNDSSEEDEEDKEGTEDTPATEEDAEESEDEDDVEDEEEDPEKRRRRNVLSFVSCLKLKRQGYCRRHVFIRRLCAATCFVPPVCFDKLSRISCLRIKGFGRCRSFTGRNYCRRTCHHCGINPIDPCRKYAVLNQLNRRQSRNRGNVLLCDNSGSFLIPRWYRFTGLAGSKMPTHVPPKNRCGTHAPGWMVGSYPRVGHVVNRKVCFHWGNKACMWHTQIKVKGCRSGRHIFYVFRLGKTPACHLRYCGNA